MCNSIDTGYDEELNIKKFPSWFGKDCDYFSGIWEDDEITGGPNYMEYEPILVYCNHLKNYTDTEGNCNKNLCPLGKKY